MFKTVVCIKKSKSEIMFKHISANELKDKIANEPVKIVDIRDPNSYHSGHISQAKLLDNSNVGDFIANTNPDDTVVVCCYHGNSSQGAAQFLAEQGLKNVYSLDGGFEMWKVIHPELVESHL